MSIAANHLHSTLPQRQNKTTKKNIYVGFAQKQHKSVRIDTVPVTKRTPPRTNPGANTNPTAHKAIAPANSNYHDVQREAEWQRRCIVRLYDMRMDRAQENLCVEREKRGAWWNVHTIPSTTLMTTLGTCRRPTDDSIVSSLCRALDRCLLVAEHA